jgi:HlyD family secretion protein
MKKDKRLLALPILAAVAALFAWNWAKSRDFRYAGTVEATEVSLSPRISSTISAMAVQEGDPVRKGQVVVELGCEDLKLASEIAGRDFARAERLYKDRAVPLETFDRDRNRRDDAALKVAWCRIESPIDGTVLARLREPGEWASPGVKLLTLADLGGVYAFIYVPQTELYRLKPGQTVEAFLPETGGAARRASIAFVRSEAEFTPKNVQTRAERTRLVYGVKIMLDNADGALKPGMPVEVRLPR